MQILSQPNGQRTAWQGTALMNKWTTGNPYFVQNVSITLFYLKTCLASCTLHFLFAMLKVQSKTRFSLNAVNHLQAMKVSISKWHIEKTIGHDSLLRILWILEVNYATLHYEIPWLGIITVLSNFFVVFFCVVIYLKTKWKKSKPAFVFIGFLASIDIILGGY